MKCPIQTPENAGVLLDYCARKLAPEATAMLERHFAQCDSCRAWADSQRAVWEALDLWEAAPVSADFDRGLYQRIRLEQPPAWWRGFIRPLPPVRLRPALSLAFASALVLAALLIEFPKSVGPAPQTQVETLDADRLERALDDVEMLRQLNLVPATDSQSM